MSLVHTTPLNFDEPFPNLPRAPIIEAVIEWKARATKLPTGKTLQEQLQQLLPDYTNYQELRTHRLQMQLRPEGQSQQTTTDGQHGLRLSTKDQQHIAHVTKNGILSSRLPPYLNWNDFISEGMRLWKIYRELAAPEHIDRLGVRFINRLGTLNQSGLQQYLMNPPVCLESLGFPQGEFLFQSLHVVPGCPVQINVIITAQPPIASQETGSSLILDLDVSTTHGLDPHDEGLIQDRLKQMRWLKDKAFFNLVQSKVIDTYRQEKS